MVWMSGGDAIRARIRPSIFNAWCVAWIVLSPVFALDQYVAVQRFESVSANALPATDYSDTADQQVARQLTLDNSHVKTVLRTAWILNTAGPRFGIHDTVADGVILPQKLSLCDLGTALRL